MDTFGKPKNVVIDPDNRVLRYSNQVRVAVAIRRGEQFAELSEFADALKEYQKALETNRNSSLAHYRIAEVFFLQNNYQSAANEFREALNGDLEPKWTEVWSHINLGKIFDITGPARPRGERVQPGHADQGQHAGRAGRSGQVSEDAVREAAAGRAVESPKIILWVAALPS